jgi:hypothetical protein
MNSALLKNPILIIDKEGLIGKPLSLELAQKFPIVFVSRKDFAGKFPTIPDEKYSHIIFIDGEGEDLELLPKIIKKVKDVNSDFIFAQELSVSGKYAVSEVLRSCPSAKVVLFGDIFGNKLILKQGHFKSTVNKFIYQAQNFGKIQVLGDGLKEAYPVSLMDVVDGLISIVSKMHPQHHLFYIFPKHPPSELALAHMIQKSNPEITVDFIRHDPRPESIIYPSNGVNLLGDKYPIAKRIRNVDVSNRISVREKKINMNIRKIKKIPVFMFWTLIFLLFFPYVFTMLFSFLGFGTLYYAKGEIDKGSMENVRNSLHLSEGIFYMGIQTSKALSLQAKIIGLENNLNPLFRNLESGRETAEGSLQAFDAGVYFSEVLTGNSKDPTADFTKGKNLLKNSIVDLQKVIAEGKVPTPILQNLESINPLIKLASNTVDALPNLLGMEGPKTYLILLQDNMELRPSGGIVRLYGILKFNKSKITEFSTYDVIEADNQLRGHVEPPFAIRRYLPSEHWYMKDGSFDVDFVKSASLISHFLLVETGNKADGVISMDMTCLKNILHAIGPIYLADYKQNIGENNLYTLAQSHAKNDFLKSLYEETITQLVNTKKSHLLIAQVISDSLMRKHLIFTSKDWQNVFTVNGWSSALWDERVDSDKFINDFVGINEANLGMNNTSFFVKRLVSQKVTIGDSGSIEEELNINYKNESTSSSGGDYKNYLRIILPKDTRLSEILINDAPQKIIDAIIDPLVYEGKKFKAPNGLEIEKVQEEEKEIFGFIVTIPAKEIVRIKLKYTLNENITLNTFSYSLKLFKQPGIDSVPYSFALIYPNSLNVISNSVGINKEAGKTSFSKEIVTDENLIINFAKK